MDEAAQSPSAMPLLTSARPGCLYFLLDLGHSHKDLLEEVGGFRLEAIFWNRLLEREMVRVF